MIPEQFAKGLVLPSVVQAVANITTTAQPTQDSGPVPDWGKTLIILGFLAMLGGMLTCAFWGRKPSIISQSAGNQQDKPAESNEHLKLLKK